jgi:hypothetical protein
LKNLRNEATLMFYVFIKAWATRRPRSWWAWLREVFTLWLVWRFLTPDEREMARRVNSWLRRATPLRVSNGDETTVTFFANYLIGLVMKRGTEIGILSLPADEQTRIDRVIHDSWLSLTPLEQGWVSEVDTAIIQSITDRLDCLE